MQTKKLLPVLLLCLTLPLSACLDSLFFRTDYKVTLDAGDKVLQEALEKDIDDHYAGLDPADDKADEQAQEEYHARLVAATMAERLKSRGYYDAAVAYKKGGKDWTGAFTATAGPLYNIRKISVTPSEYAALLPDLQKLAGQPLDAAAVLAQQKKLYEDLRKNGCYFTLKVGNETELDKKTKTADIVIKAEAGPRTVFADAAFEGNTTIKTSYLNRLVPWKKGDCFDPNEIEFVRAAMFESGLIASVETLMPDTPGVDGVPVTFRVKERAHRTIGAGLTYYTDEGPGATFSWKHRNFFGAGEQAEVLLKTSMLVQSLETKFIKPYFLRQDQTLSLNASLGREDTDAYMKTGISAGAAVKRKINERLTFSTGVNLSIEKIDDEALGTQSTFGLVSFPQKATYDSRDSILDPTKGWLLEGAAQPFVDAFGEASPFFKTEANVRKYVAVARKTVIAGRLKLGSIWGASQRDIPATQRFYAGGGSSVRGFGYQEVGPQIGSDPEGGRSVIEMSAEVRHKFNDTYGVVAFVDAGNVDKKSTPGMQDLHVGAGVGFRYYTGFGPLRFDVAVPVNKRDVADSYQVYISIGQSF